VLGFSHGFAPDERDYGKKQPLRLIAAVCNAFDTDPK